MSWEGKQRLRRFGRLGFDSCRREPVDLHFSRHTPKNCRQIKFYLFISIALKRKNGEKMTMGREGTSGNSIKTLPRRWFRKEHSFRPGRIFSSFVVLGYLGGEAVYATKNDECRKSEAWPKWMFLTEKREIVLSCAHPPLKNIFSDFWFKKRNLFYNFNFFPKNEIDWWKRAWEIEQIQKVSEKFYRPELVVFFLQKDFFY